MQIIDLSSSWNYRTDEKGNGIQEQYYNQEFVSSPFLLPGSTCDNHIGTPTQYHEEFNPQTVRAPRERYEYVGPLWLQKKIAIPQSFRTRPSAFSWNVSTWLPGFGSMGYKSTDK